jgi:mono/diheme cytochrome c family protein
MADGQSGDGLFRWLLGGLVVGLIVLGLMVAAYAVGYHHGKAHRNRSAAPATTTQPPAQTTTRTAPATTATTPSQSPAQLLVQGKALYTGDGCSGCHSLTGAAGAGPTFKGLAGSTVTLTDGSTVTADDAYLSRSITDPDAQIVKGYQSGIMSAAIASHALGTKLADVEALVAFIKAQR